MLRVVICGSAVDDVAALIDRLSESYQPCGDDRLGGDANISADPKSGGLAALLGDPEPAREPGTAREATFRSFQKANHRLVVTGVSGDEQRTRSLVAAASTADLVVPLVDARMGVSDQTRRCTVVASLLGIRRIVLAVNAADLAKCSQGAFDAIAGEFVAFAGPLKFAPTARAPNNPKDPHPADRPDRPQTEMAGTLRRARHPSRSDSRAALVRYATAF